MKVDFDQSFCSSGADSRLLRVHKIYTELTHVRTALHLAGRPQVIAATLARDALRVFGLR